ncbi:hypothetical protein NQ314_001865 [Rhamnusium bicolor]|uniref:THAP-type domain-containing protein n=1 Tax=Rhamnusium bicolor TaxID=1586634 RepID=A0AAV8ZSD1_9CUCU|nr:hypothetical protein NQ314_001865 [Rhamnusium bicolor]
MQKRREKWFAAARRDIKKVSEKSTLYCCEDHFKLEEDMEIYVEYKLSKVSARLKPNVVPHLFACQPDKSSSKKRVRESSEKRSRKKLIVDLMKQSVQKMETEITEESIPEETSQLVQNLPSTSGIVQRREVTLTSPLKTVVSDLRKPTVKRVLQFNKGPVEPKLTRQLVDTSDSSDIYQPTESTGSDETIKITDRRKTNCKTLYEYNRSKVKYVYWTSDQLCGIY